jgi:hypothetical protein
MTALASALAARAPALQLSWLARLPPPLTLLLLRAGFKMVLLQTVEVLLVS